MKRLLTAVTTVMMVMGCAAVAQTAPNRVERANDRQALRQDARERADDRRDAAKMASFTADFDAARASNNTAALASLDQRVAAHLASEQREGAREQGRDQKEIRQDKRELGSDRRELGRDAVTGAGPGVKADDRHDKRDDRRDLRDDKRDAVVEANANARTSGLAAEWNSLVGRVDPASLDRKRAILAQLDAMAGHELARDRQETREDKREIREDRKETREDRRQR